MFVSGGRWEPREYDLKEYWTWKGVGQPPWYVRAIRRHRDGGKTALTSQEHDFGPQIARPGSFPDSHADSSTKEESTGITEQPILSRPTPEQMSRLSR